MPLTPTLFVGVGGMGSAIVRATLKKLEMAEKFRGVPSDLYVCICVDPVPMGERLTTVTETGSRNVQFVLIRGYDRRTVDSMLQSPDRYGGMRSWYYPNFDCGLVDLGSNQIRLNGRVGLFRNFLQSPVPGSPSMHDAILMALDRCAGVGRTSADVRTDSVHAWICCSLCGGTGSGMMLDLAYFLRSQLPGAVRVHVLGMFVLPDVMRRVAGSDQIFANAYAALKELNWFMMDPDKSDSPREGQYYQMRIGTVNMDERRMAVRSPFDLCFLVSDVSDTGHRVGDYRRTTEMVAEFLYEFSVEADLAQYIPNIAPGGRPALATVAGSGEKVPLGFGSCGVYTLRFPVNRVATYFANEIACILLRDYIVGEAEGVAQTMWRDLLEKTHIEPEPPEDEERPEEEPEAPAEIEKDLSLPGIPSVETKLEEIDGVSNMPCDIANKYEQEIKNALRSRDEVQAQIQKNIERLEESILAVIDGLVDDAFGQKRQNVFGAVDGFLQKVEHYCKRFTDEQYIKKNNITRKDGSLVLTLKQQAAELRKSAIPDKEDIERIGKKWRKLWKPRGAREEMRQILNNMLKKLTRAEVLDALHHMYIRIQAFAEAKRLPIRFFRDDVARVLMDQYDSAGASVLSDVSLDEDLAGLGESVFCTQKQLEALIKPRLAMFGGDGTEAEKRKNSAGHMIEASLGIVREMQNELRRVGTAQREILRSSADAWVKKLRECVSKVVYEDIKGELQEKFSIADIVLLEAEWKGIREKEELRNYVNERLNGLAKKLEGWGGMKTDLEELVEGQQVRRSYILVMDDQRFENVVRARTGDQNYQIDIGLLQLQILRSTDPFRITAVYMAGPLPAFAIFDIDDYHEKYDEPTTPRHIDCRFEPNGELALPDVEIVGGQNDDDVYLFLLATIPTWRPSPKTTFGTVTDNWLDLALSPSDSDIKRIMGVPADWWQQFRRRQLERYPGEGCPDLPTECIYRGGEKEGGESVASEKRRSSEMWWLSGGGSGVTAHGRKHAQLKLVQDPGGIKGAIREMVASAWNVANDNVRRRILKLYAQILGKAAEKTRYKELKATYQNDVRVIESRLQSGRLDI